MGNCFSYLGGGAAAAALDMEKQREAARAALELEEQEELDRQFLDDGPTVPLPDVPRSVPRKPRASEDKIEELY